MNTNNIKITSHQILMYIYNFLLQLPVYSSEHLIFLKLVQSISIPKVVECYEAGTILVLFQYDLNFI